MPKYYPDHFYAWGYALFCLVALLMVCIGAFLLIKQHRSLAIILLIVGCLSGVGAQCIADVGWLIVSGGDNSIDCIKEPKMCAASERIRDIAMILYYISMAALAVAVPLLAHELNRIKKKPNKTRHDNPY